MEGMLSQFVAPWWVGLSVATALGFVAGLLVTVSMIPQLVRTFRMKNADGISLSFTVLLWTGMGFWLAYGISLDLVQVITWNAIGMTSVSALIVMKIRYGRRKGGDYGR